MNEGPQVAGPQAESAVTSRPAPSGGPRVLDEAQRVLLKAVLNRIVPAHGDLPGAGDLSVGESIERTLSESPRLRRLFIDGLTEIALRGSNFPELEAARQTAVLEAVEQDAPAFFVALVEHAYRGYYTFASVQLAVGFEPRPPQPFGHELAPFDPALLEQQRQRGSFWRRTD